mmetsp:Transcript_16496/g.33437  ORF Transcript_16496/g.33437 Transcript_16496/m.33437 type:complete len:206 (+) Transcript_16496:268-885(+)
MLSSSMKPASCVPSFSLVTTIFPAFKPGRCMTIHALACLTRWSGFKQISKMLSSTGERTCSTIGSGSPGSTLSSNGPGKLKPGPSTNNHPAFSADGSSSTHSPPEGPLHVFPVVLTLEPTLRLSFVILEVVGSDPTFFMRGPCITRHSSAPAHAAPAASAGACGCSSAGASGAAAASLGAVSSAALMPTPARMSLRAFLAARLTS